VIGFMLCGEHTFEGVIRYSDVAYWFQHS